MYAPPLPRRPSVASREDVLSLVKLYTRTCILRLLDVSMHAGLEPDRRRFHKVARREAMDQ